MIGFFNFLFGWTSLGNHSGGSGFGMFGNGIDTNPLGGSSFEFDSWNDGL